MPSSLSLAVVTPSSTVLPQTLCTSFVEQQVYPVLLIQSYHDSTIERSMLVDGINAPRPRRTWRLAKRLTTVKLTELLTFFEARNGGHQPFYFYDPYAALEI